ncbi:Transcription factor, partial [Gamsiella multidivaricata]
MSPIEDHDFFPDASNDFVDALWTPEEEDKMLAHAMERQGVKTWKNWCQARMFSDGYFVTLEKFIEYVETTVLPKEIQVLKASTDRSALPVLGTESLVLPVLRLWRKQEHGDDDTRTSGRKRRLSIPSMSSPVIPSLFNAISQSALAGASSPSEQVSIPANQSIQPSSDHDSHGHMSTEAHYPDDDSDDDIYMISSSAPKSIEVIDLESIKTEEEDEMEGTQWRPVKLSPEESPPAESSTAENDLSRLEYSLDITHSISVLIESISKYLNLPDPAGGPVNVQQLISPSFFEQLRVSQSRAQQLGLSGLYCDPLLITVLEEHVKTIQALFVRLESKDIDIIPARPTNSGARGKQRHQSLEGADQDNILHLESVNSRSSSSQSTTASTRKSNGQLKYMMFQGDHSIQHIWDQMTKGINGNPSIKELDERYGTTWGVEKDRLYLLHSRTIVREIQRLMTDKGMTESEAIDSLQQRLGAKSLATLAQCIVREHPGMKNIMHTGVGTIQPRIYATTDQVPSSEPSSPDYAQAWNEVVVESRSNKPAPRSAARSLKKETTSSAASPEATATISASSEAISISSAVVAAKTTASLAATTPPILIDEQPATTSAPPTRLAAPSTPTIISLAALSAATDRSALIELPSSQLSPSETSQTADGPIASVPDLFQGNTSPAAAPDLHEGSTLTPIAIASPPVQSPTTTTATVTATGTTLTQDLDLNLPRISTSRYGQMAQDPILISASVSPMIPTSASFAEIPVQTATTQAASVQPTVTATAASITPPTQMVSFAPEEHIANPTPTSISLSKPPFSTQASIPALVSAPAHIQTNGPNVA